MTTQPSPRPSSQLIGLEPAPCVRCNGRGFIGRWAHRFKGRCYRCNGSGDDPKRTVPVYSMPCGHEFGDCSCDGNYTMSVIGDRP